MKPNAIVLGCGPAGLLAAHAARTSGLFEYIRILSRKVKSPIYGAQYLHSAIPMIPFDYPVVVKQILWGSGEKYARKVYADLYDPRLPNSAEQYTGDRTAWDIRNMYDWLWAEYSEYVEDFYLPNRVEMVAAVESLHLPGHIIFNTIPRRTLCKNPGVHQFDFKQIWAAGDSPMRQLDFRTEEDQIICNGEESPRWYRMSRVFGYTTVEWPDSKTPPPVEGVAHVTKPLRTNCDCWPAIRHLGRYGQWKKGVLAHTAYYEAADRILEMYRQGLLV